MDVIKTNFIELLPKIKKSIDEADFIAIDTELTGLGKERTFNLFDTQAERYSKIRQTSFDYLMIQLGLTAFHSSDRDSNTFTCECYNFYIFPYKANGASKSFDRSFLVQPSALSFLVNHDFDFNKWIKEGITYLNIEEEEKFLESLKKREEEKQEGSKNYVPEEHKKFIDEFMNSLQNFVQDSKRDRLELSPCSAYRRKLIYESAKRSQFDNIRLSTCQVSSNSSNRFIAIDKVPKEQQMIDQENLILETIGMSKVVQHLIQSKKPVVGHNVLLDLMHIIHHFIAPLPDSYCDFKNMLKELFPYCYDTKLIASASQFKELLPSMICHCISLLILSSCFNFYRHSPS